MTHSYNSWCMDQSYDMTEEFRDFYSKKKMEFKKCKVNRV